MKLALQTLTNSSIFILEPSIDDDRIRRLNSALPPDRVSSIPSSSHLLLHLQLKMAAKSKYPQLILLGDSISEHAQLLRDGFCFQAALSERKLWLIFICLATLFRLRSHLYPISLRIRFMVLIVLYRLCPKTRCHQSRTGT